jgi:DNA-binding CsgD family transcriptional regulator
MQGRISIAESDYLESRSNSEWPVGVRGVGAMKGKASLSARERQVLGLIGEGHTDGEIARQLCISVNTVQNHVKNILRKLDARNRTHASSIYQRE